MWVRMFSLDRSPCSWAAHITYYGSAWGEHPAPRAAFKTHVYHIGQQQPGEGAFLVSAVIGRHALMAFLWTAYSLWVWVARAEKSWLAWPGCGCGRCDTLLSTYTLTHNQNAKGLCGSRARSRRGVGTLWEPGHWVPWSQTRAWRLPRGAVLAVCRHLSLLALWRVSVLSWSLVEKACLASYVFALCPSHCKTATVCPSRDGTGWLLPTAGSGQQALPLA